MPVRFAKKSIMELPLLETAKIHIKNKGNEMNTIPFVHNWNQKLDSSVFTTIRKSTPDKMNYYYDCLGKEFSVLLSKKEKCKAKLLDMVTIKLKDIPDYVLCTDTGCASIVEAKEVFIKFGIKNEDECLILLFARKWTWNLEKYRIKEPENL